jgi:transcription elongation GreA/GreB family factor
VTVDRQRRHRIIAAARQALRALDASASALEQRRAKRQVERALAELARIAKPCPVDR